MIDTAAPIESRKRAQTGARWNYAGFVGRHQSVIQSRNLNLQLYAEAFMWFHKIADFRCAESHLLYAKRPDKQVLSEHRQIVSFLISEGKNIVRRIRASGGFIKPVNGFSLADIQSAIEELDNTRVQWSGTMSKGRKKEILKAIFDAA